MDIVVSVITYLWCLILCVIWVVYGIEMYLKKKYK